MTDMSPVGQRIADARIAAGLSQDELAQELRKLGSKASESAVSKWERGINEPRPATLARIWMVLGVEGNPDEIRAMMPERLQKFTDKLGDLVTGLTIEQQRRWRSELIALATNRNEHERPATWSPEAETIVDLVSQYLQAEDAD